jgi:glycerate kinase
MNVVIALDSFKGSLTAEVACRTAAAAVLRAVPGIRVRCVPMADGGEGTAEALVSACGGHFVCVPGVSGPLPGQRLDAAYGWLPEGPTAVVEMAKASGLPLVPPDRRQPGITTTRGTGELIADALRRGAARLVITLGGSATSDGGAGAAAVLGWQFLDASGHPLPEGGAALLRLARIIPPAQSTPAIPVQALCDVSNPLCGPNGAAAVYGPQKGATPEQVRDLDAALEVLSRRIREDLGLAVGDLPGAGAAGGFGAGAVAFLGARLVPGVETVAELTGLTDALRTADWVITGEGRLDSQSLQGKVVSGVLRRAVACGTRVAVVAGTIALDRAALRAAGIAEAEACTPAGMSVAAAMEHAAVLLNAATGRLARRLGG